MLRYMDDQSLRKRIDDQLDKLESTHTFARDVFYGLIIRGCYCAG
ncbi:transposase [Hymenobacter cellulosivorans]|nr:transposase [Hymenobacter cellulosivorans]